MSTRISSLTVRDFRSIRGNVTVPMDAPIVLVHGKNGAGKTSFLLASAFHGLAKLSTGSARGQLTPSAFLRNDRRQCGIVGVDHRIHIIVRQRRTVPLLLHSASQPPHGSLPQFRFVVALKVLPVRTIDMPHIQHPQRRRHRGLLRQQTAEGHLLGR